MTESQEQAVLTIRFPMPLANRLREVAERDYRSVGSLVRQLVAKGLEAEAKKSA